MNYLDTIVDILVLFGMSSIIAGIIALAIAVVLGVIF